MVSSAEEVADTVLFGEELFRQRLGNAFQYPRSVKQPETSWFSGICRRALRFLAPQAPPRSIFGIPRKRPKCSQEPLATPKSDPKIVLPRLGLSQATRLVHKCFDDTKRTKKLNPQVKSSLALATYCCCRCCYCALEWSTLGRDAMHLSNLPCARHGAIFNPVCRRTWNGGLLTWALVCDWAAKP